METGGPPPHHPPRSSPDAPWDATASGDDHPDARGGRQRAGQERAGRGRRQPGGDDDRGAGDSRPARDPHAVAKAIVLRQLTNSPKTRAQLEQALAKRECVPQVAREVLDRLTEVGLVDDTAYAQIFVRSKQQTRALAKSALRRELRTKGVDDETAAEVLDGLSDAAEEEQARELVRARIPRLHGLDRQVQVRRLAGLLARKGYPSSIAGRVVFEELDLAAEHRRD